VDKIEEVLEEPKSLLEEIRSIENDSKLFSTHSKLHSFDRVIHYINARLRYAAYYPVSANTCVRIAYCNITSYARPDRDIINSIIAYYINLGFRVYDFTDVMFIDIYWR
jgi:hypothetical protein